MYFFYDLETSGLNRFFDQPLQIGIVVTDDDFNVIKTYDVKCRLLPWVVPMPGALMTTGMLPEEITSEKLPDFYAAMRQVFDIINDLPWPLTFAGYNSIGYDNALFSSALHQALLDPFVMSGRQKWTDNGKKFWGAAPNRSMDILNVVRAVQVYAPGTLTLNKTNVRKLDDGTTKETVSLKLVDVAQQNGVNLDEGTAHNAIADILATVGLAKLVKKAAPEIWAQMTKMSQKAEVEKFVAANPVFAYTPGYEAASYAVASVATFQSKIATFDLSFDPTEFIGKTPQELARYLRSKGDDDELPIEKDKNPFRSFKANAQPILMPVGEATPEMQARAAQIKAAKDFQDNLAAAFKIAFPEIIGREPEEHIYQFPSKDQRNDIDAWLKNVFVAPDAATRRKLMDDFENIFGAAIEKEKKDNEARHGNAFSPLERYLKFAQRRVYVETPELMEPAKKSAYAKGIHRRLTGQEDAPYGTLKQALAEVAQFRVKIAAGEPVPGKDLASSVRMLDRLEAWYGWLAQPPEQRGAFVYAPAEGAKKKIAPPEASSG